MTRQESALKRRFGLTPGQYEMLLNIQSGGCALCRRPPKTVRLNVDHDHRTGIIRGLLCHRCNRGLGYFSDPEVLRRAAVYLCDANTGYQVPKRKRKRRRADGAPTGPR